MFDTQVTVVGNLVADPRMTETKDGQPIASFRLASTPAPVRSRDRGVEGRRHSLHQRHLLALPRGERAPVPQEGELGHRDRPIVGAAL